MHTPLFISIVYNAALLVCLVIVYNLAAGHSHRTFFGDRIVSGLAIGAITVVTMLYPLRFAEGVIFDTRSVLLSLSGLFFGFIPTLIASVMASAYRIFTGGIGAGTGVGVILFSAGAGLLWRKYRSGEVITLKISNLYLFGFLVHVGMLLLMLTLPRQISIKVLRQLTLPVMVIYPLITAAIGNMFVESEKRTASARELERNRNILNNSESLSGAGGWEWDVEGKLMFWTDETYNIHDLPRDTLPAGSPEHLERSLACYRPEDRPRIQEAFRRCVQNGEPYDMEVPFTTERGRGLWVRTRAHALEKNGRIVKVVGNIMDITEERRRQDSLEKINRGLHMNRILSSMLMTCENEETLLKNACRAIVETGAYSAAWAGYRDLRNGVEHSPRTAALSLADDLAEQNVTAAGILRAFKEAVSAALTGKATVTVSETRESSSPSADWPADVSACAIALPLRFRNNVTGVLLIVSLGSTAYDHDENEVLQEIARNIGLKIQTLRERKLRYAMEEELRDRNHFIQTILDNMPIGVAVNSIDTGAVTFMNREFEETYGWSSDEIQNVADFFEKVYPDPEYRRKIEKEVMEDIQSGDPERMVWEGVEATGKDGKERAILAKNIPLFEQNLMISTVQDITDRKLLESQLVQSQKMEIVGRLAGGVAHDINNALLVIMGYTELALAKLPAEQSIREELLYTLNAAENSKMIVSQLLALARKQPIDPKVLNLNENVTEILPMLKKLLGENIEIRWIAGDGLWNVKFDPNQLSQVLMNVSVNARDAIGTGKTGKITLETHNTTLDHEYCKVHQGCTAGENVLLAVSDDGCGMSSDTLKKVFEPFFTTKPEKEGTGLGMSIVYAIIKQNDGYVTLYSEKGMGTTVKIYLPRETGVLTEAKEKTSTLAPMGDGETVLFVEDEKMNLELGRKLLTMLGYNVLTASRPSEAVELMEEHADTVDLLITDVILPEMNGKELAERLCTSSPDLKIIYMSGYTEDVIPQRELRGEGISFLQKPFSLKDLALKIREVL